MVKTVAKLQNLRRMPGDQGTLKMVARGGIRQFMTPDWSEFTPFPTSKYPLLTVTNQNKIADWILCGVAMVMLFDMPAATTTKE